MIIIGTHDVPAEHPGVIVYDQARSQAGGRVMGWEDEHKRRVAEFPDNVRVAHLHSIDHRAEILASESCGCFYCCAIFPPGRITEWTDATNCGEGQTALCPVCGIDSVIGDRSGAPITGEFLTEMHAYWF